MKCAKCGHLLTDETAWFTARCVTCAAYHECIERRTGISVANLLARAVGRAECRVLFAFSVTRQRTAVSVDPTKAAGAARWGRYGSYTATCGQRGCLVHLVPTEHTLKPEKPVRTPTEHVEAPSVNAPWRNSMADAVGPIKTTKSGLLPREQTPALNGSYLNNCKKMQQPLDVWFGAVVHQLHGQRGAV